MEIGNHQISINRVKESLGSSSNRKAYAIKKSEVDSHAQHEITYKKSKKQVIEQFLKYPNYTTKQENSVYMHIWSIHRKKSGRMHPG